MATALSGSSFWMSTRQAPPSDVHLAYCFDPVAMRGRQSFSFHDEALSCSFSHGLRGKFTYSYFGTAKGLIALQVSNLVSKKFCGCIIFNPASRIEATLVFLDFDSKNNLCGFGYCPTAKKFKILMLRNGSIMVKTLGDRHSTQPRSIPPSDYISQLDPSICQDDKIYMLEAGGHGNQIRRLIAFDIQEETSMKVDLPPEALHSGLLQLSGSICVASQADTSTDVVLWQLNLDQGWQKISVVAAPCQARVFGAWQPHPSKLLIWFEGWGAALYQNARGSSEGDPVAWKLTYEDYREADLGAVLGSWQKKAGLVFCWGYEPTFISPLEFFKSSREDHQELVSFVTGDRAVAPRLGFVRCLAEVLSG
uniref:Predicted protein n=1 Tax=Hordeum vulgare subsp. vulgare TaxID=112509 RepID=F2EI02_HORVV|nr:predicted protein [Hordeum vulgare subsp. vulgare]